MTDVFNSGSLCGFSGPLWRPAGGHGKSPLRSRVAALCTPAKRGARPLPRVSQSRTPRPQSATEPEPERSAHSRLWPERAAPAAAVPDSAHAETPRARRARPRSRPTGNGGNPPTAERSGLFTISASAAGGNPRLQLLLTSPRRASGPRAAQPPGPPRSPAPDLPRLLPSPKRPT